MTSVQFMMRNSVVPRWSFGGTTPTELSILNPTDLQTGSIVMRSHHVNSINLSQTLHRINCD